MIKSGPAGVEINIFVLPRSSRCAVVGIYNNQLKIKLTKPPVDGKANYECCRFIAKLLGIPKTRVNVIRGACSRYKVLLVKGVDRDHVLKAISGSLEPHAC